MTITLTFFRGRRGDVISRLPNGKICVVDKRSRRKPAPGEEWVCSITEKERVAIVYPLKKIVEKERPVLRRFNCGHLVQVWMETIKVPEDEEPEPRISDIIEPELCEECKKRCKHDNIELARSSYWIAVNCKDCETTLWSMDLNEPSDADKALSEISKKFSELAREAEKELSEWKKWVSEYREKAEKAARLSEIIGERKKRIVELVWNTEISEYAFVFKRRDRRFWIDIEKQRFMYYTTVKDAPNEVSTVEAYKPLPAEHVNEIIELWKELRELERKRDELEQWLTENRPVE